MSDFLRDWDISDWDPIAGTCIAKRRTADGITITWLTEKEARESMERSFKLIPPREPGRADRKITRPAIEGKVLWASSLGMEPVSITVEEVPEAQAVDYEGRKIAQPDKSVAQMMSDPRTRQLALDHIQAWTQIGQVTEITGGGAYGFVLDEAGVPLRDDKTNDDCKPKFHVTVKVDPATASSRQTAMQVAAMAGRALGRAVMSRVDVRKAFMVAEPKQKEAPPAPLHPLQRLSSQPNGFGQSLWRPWE